MPRTTAPESRPSPRITVPSRRSTTLDDLPRHRLLAAVFLISVASLALEVLQIRMFAYALWQHLAFLVISIAMLGFGAAGSVLSASKRLREASLGNSLAIAALLFAATAIVGPYYLATNPIDIFQQVGRREITITALYYLIFSLPFFFAGYTVALALTRASGSIGILYGANMLGSGIGCFLIFFTLMPLGAGGSLFVLAGLGAVVAAIASRSGALRAAAAGLAVLLIAASPFIEARPGDDPPNAIEWFPELLDREKIAANAAVSAPPDQPWYKLRFQPARTKMMMQMWNAVPESELVVSEWTPLCKIDVLVHGNAGVLVQDGDAGAPLWRSEEPILARDLTHVPHLVLDEPDVLIIGSGGGRELQTAIEHGSKSIMGVEINPVTVDVCLDPELTVVPRMKETHPELDVKQGEGRYFVRSSDEKYDLITMTGVDTYTALVSGAYVVSESYLYTKEAVLDFLDHLTDDGVVSYIRFAFPTPRETLKMMVIACTALRERGVERPWEHVAILRNAADSSPFTSGTILACTLIKKEPFSEEDRAALRAFAEKHSLMPEYVPGDPARFSEEQLANLRELIAKNPLFEEYPLNDEGINPFHAYAKALREGEEERFLQEYPYNVRPVTDDRPFFFNQHYFSSLWTWLRGRTPTYEIEGDKTWMGASTHFQLRPTGMILLFLTLSQLLVLAAVCIFGPLLFLRRERGGRRAGFPVAIAYFASLGFGYIFLMMSSVQRFGLVLGHPSYAISVTMATFLVSSGLGATLSGRFDARRGQRIVLGVAAVLLAATVLLHFGLPAITRAVLGQPFAVRVLVTVLLLAPMAFVMGLCFPIGLRVLKERNESFIPWAYAVNGTASVLGSVLAVVLAMGLGFAAVQGVAALLYVVAALAIGGMLAHRTAPA